MSSDDATFAPLLLLLPCAELAALGVSDEVDVMTSSSFSISCERATSAWGEARHGLDADGSGAAGFSTAKMGFSNIMSACELSCLMIPRAKSRKDRLRHD